MLKIEELQNEIENLEIHKEALERKDFFDTMMERNFIHGRLSEKKSEYCKLLEEAVAPLMALAAGAMSVAIISGTPSDEAAEAVVDVLTKNPDVFNDYLQKTIKALLK